MQDTNHIDKNNSNIPDEHEEMSSDLILEGKNAVMEALKSGRTIDKVFLETNNANLSHIAAMAKNGGTVVVNVDRKKLDKMSKTGRHQGVMAVVSDFSYATIEEIVKAAHEKNQKPLIVVCDEVEDPHNLGAIIRNADAAGAHGVIIPKRRSPGVNAVVARASAGAVSHVLVARVSNIASAIKELKDLGVWIYGTDAGGDKPLYEADFIGSTAIVIGSEGYGMGRLVKELCDFVVSIPMQGKVSSLNASAASAVMLFEAVRQRKN